jgi:hypothetical protein
LRETGNIEHKRENGDKQDKTTIQKTTKRNGNYKNIAVNPGAHESFFVVIYLLLKKSRGRYKYKNMTCIYNFT